MKANHQEDSKEIWGGTPVNDSTLMTLRGQVLNASLPR